MTAQHATIMKDPCYERMGVQALLSGQHQWNVVRAPARTISGWGTVYL